MVMAVYSPGDVEISTTISIGVIGVIVMVILFYLWLCAVSLYQSLKEIQNMGSDQVKIVVMVLMIVMIAVVMLMMVVVINMVMVCGGDNNPVLSYMTLYYPTLEELGGSPEMLLSESRID